MNFLKQTVVLLLCFFTGIVQGESLPIRWSDRALNLLNSTPPEEQISTPSAERANRLSPIVLAVTKVMPSVVNLSTEKKVDGDTTEKWFEFPNAKKNGGEKEFSLGSGCIIDDSGLILTNAHVVRRSIRTIVTLYDGQRVLAETVVADDLNDLALLRIVEPLSKCKSITMGEPGDLLLGETVIVVGNPYGLDSSIADGILSAIGRKIVYDGRVLFNDILQTSATIYPGNSGGPLINVNGEMIGINTAVLKEAQGISFAIPLQRVENVLGQWLIPERFSEVSLGIVPGVRRLSDGRLFFYFQNILPDSPAAKAGLKVEMQIRKIDGVPLNNLMDFLRKLWQVKANESLEIETDQGVFVVKAVPLGTLDWQHLAEMKLGIGFQALTPELQKALEYPDFHAGLVVSDVGAYPANSGIKRGDILVQLGNIFINSTEDLTRELRNIRFGQEIPAVFLEVAKRDGGTYVRKKKTILKVKP